MVQINSRNPWDSPAQSSIKRRVGQQQRGSGDGGCGIPSHVAARQGGNNKDGDENGAPDGDKNGAGKRVVQLGEGRRLGRKAPLRKQEERKYDGLLRVSWANKTQACPVGPGLHTNKANSLSSVLHNEATVMHAATIHSDLEEAGWDGTGLLGSSSALGPAAGSARFSLASHRGRISQHRMVERSSEGLCRTKGCSWATVAQRAKPVVAVREPAPSRSCGTRGSGSLCTQRRHHVARSGEIEFGWCQGPLCAAILRGRGRGATHGMICLSRTRPGGRRAPSRDKQTGCEVLVVFPLPSRHRGETRRTENEKKSDGQASRQARQGRQTDGHRQKETAAI